MGKKARKNKGGPKAVGDAEIDNGVGHNSVIKPKELEDFLKRFDRLCDKKETVVAEVNSDIKSLYEEGASKLGVKRKMLRAITSEHRHQQKLAEQQAQYDGSEKDDHDRLMAAAASFAGTPFGAYAASQANVK